MIPLPYKILATLLLAIGIGLIGYGSGSHVRGLADSKAYAALQASQVHALLAATQAARSAQMQADAVQLVQQQAATQSANAAVDRHADDLAQAQAQNATLQARLQTLATRQPVAKTWLSSPIPAEVLHDACTFDADGRPSAGC